MDNQLTRLPGRIESDSGWLVRLVDPELIEYRCGEATCLVNVAYSPAMKAREIYASEAASEWFPNLIEHLISALPLLEGRYVVV